MANDSDVFAEQRTGLRFPARIGHWVRHNVTTYPVQSAGISITYQLRNWMGRPKVQIGVDVYDKGMQGIPAGPHSCFVSIELQNHMHGTFAEVPAPDESVIDDCINGSGAAEEFGEIDATGRLRFDARPAAIDGRRFHYIVYLTGHRGHFVKIQVLDFSMGASMKEVSALINELLDQMATGERGQIT
jgi:hypothetical protein